MNIDRIKSPVFGSKVTMGDNGKLLVPDKPIIPFIEGDGIGADIWKTSVNVFNAAVKKAYGDKRAVDWLEIYAGEKANDVYGPNTWLPSETLDIINEYLKASDYELENLRIRIFQMYDLYLKQSPDYTILDTDERGTKISYKLREKMTVEEMRIKYKSLHWLNELNKNQGTKNTKIQVSKEAMILQVSVFSIDLFFCSSIILTS